MLPFLVGCASTLPSDSAAARDSAETSAETGTSADTAADTGERDTGEPRDSAAETDPPGDTGTVSEGLVLLGSEAGDDAGRTLAVGDVDGDGADDLLSASHHANSSLGAGFFVPGPVTASGELDMLGTRIPGDRAANGAGRSVSLGDADGDGVLDLGFGAPFGTRPGLWIVSTPLGEAPAVADASAALIGPNDYCGHGSALADLDGDGIADGAVGCYSLDIGARDAGGVYVAFGPFSGEVDLQAEPDVLLTGEEASTYAGRFLAAGDDVDGDGIGDLLVGAPSASVGPPSGGAAFLVYGPPATGSLADADGRYLGESPSAYAGETVAFGDVDGDGLSDVLVGSWDATGGSQAGAAYVVLGPSDGEHDLGGSDIVVRGAAGDLAGTGLAAGDADHDGRADLVLGAGGPNYSDAPGRVALFSAPAAGTWSLTDATRTWDGAAAGDGAGTSVKLGDVDGDGGLEILVGAPGVDEGGSGAGALYVLEGG